LFDNVESGLIAVASGADLDGDGIDDGVAPNTYHDPDGVVNTTSPDLANEAGSLAEVGFREVFADLVTVKTLTSGDATPDVGDVVTFEIEVTNNGASQATNVSLSDLQELTMQLPVSGQSERSTLATQ